jgi:hypothetical protein
MADAAEAMQRMQSEFRGSRSIGKRRPEQNCGIAPAGRGNMEIEPTRLLSS